MLDFKKFLSQLIFIAVLGAAVAFVYSLFIPKIWQITGKIVVVPSGTSPTAGPNLFVEGGNTAEMINSLSFRERILGDNAQFLASAAQTRTSSTVAVNFEGAEENVQTIEDMIVQLPQNIATYTRDVYGGSPFKYLIASDPEVSAQPVRPNIIRNVFAGFGIGALAYFLYWLYFASFFESAVAQRQSIVSPQVGMEIAPDLAPAEEEVAPAQESEVARIFDGEEKKSGAPEKDMAKKMPTSPAVKTAAAPANLPFVEQAPPPSSELGESAEPSDEEVKERLNRLMRGEL